MRREARWPSLTCRRLELRSPARALGTPQGAGIDILSAGRGRVHIVMHACPGVASFAHAAPSGNVWCCPFVRSTFAVNRWRSVLHFSEPPGIGSPEAMPDTKGQTHILLLNFVMAWEVNLATSGRNNVHATRGASFDPFWTGPCLMRCFRWPRSR